MITSILFLRQKVQPQRNDKTARFLAKSALWDDAECVRPDNKPHKFSPTPAQNKRQEFDLAGIFFFS
jgi:hypothetical protein